MSFMPWSFRALLPVLVLFGAPLARAEVDSPSGPLARGKLKVVATLPSFADLARQVGGEEVEVVSLVQGTEDPHFVDAKPALLPPLHRAELLIRAGLGLEDSWLPALVIGAQNEKLRDGTDSNLDASTVVVLAEVPPGRIDQSLGNVHAGGNPHFMLDPRNAVLLTQAIAERFGKLVPAKAAGFQQRAQAYSKELQLKIAAWEVALKPLTGRPVVTYHKSWVYFSAWVGLKEVGTLESKPGIPPSPAHILALVKLMREKSAKLLLLEPYYPISAAKLVARDARAKVLVLPSEVHGAPSVKSYIGLMDRIVAQLKRL